MRFRIVVAAYAVWLFALFYVFYLVQGKNENALQLAVMGGLIPAGCQFFLLGVDLRGLVAPMKIWLALLLVILLSYLFSAMNPQTAPTGSDGMTIPAAWTPMVYTLNTAFVLGIGTLVAGCPDRRLLRSIASLYCVIATPFLVYIDLTGKMVWGRLFADLQPNVWGLMGLTVCLGAFARKPGPLAVAAFAGGAFTILQASSRENMVALAFALLALGALYVRDMNRPRFWVILVGAGVTLAAMTLLLDPYILNAIDYISHDIFMVDNRYRGVDSGFTGRTGIWGETIDLWLKWPILGVGFRQHEQFLAGTPAHNAYLAMLADTGIFGLIIYLVLLIGSLIASWSIDDPRTRRFVVALLVTYVIIGFFERRAINSGNPYGVFFLMCCSVALVDQSLRRAARRIGSMAGDGGLRSAPPVTSSAPGIAH
jgi:O-antigen ligase